MPVMATRRRLMRRRRRMRGPHPPLEPLGGSRADGGLDDPRLAHLAAPHHRRRQELRRRATRPRMRGRERDARPCDRAARTPPGSRRTSRSRRTRRARRADARRALLRGGRGPRADSRERPRASVRAPRSRSSPMRRSVCASLPPERRQRTPPPAAPSPRQSPRPDRYAPAASSRFGTRGPGPRRAARDRRSSGSWPR